MKSSLKWLWHYSSGFKIRLLVIILLNIGGIFFSLAFVESTKIFINDAITGKDIIFFVAVTLIGLKVAQLLCEQGEIYIRTLSRVQFENNLEYLKSATKLFSVLLASKRPLITELADKLRLKYPLLPTISPCPTMRLEAIRSIIPISCRRYPKSV